MHVDLLITIPLLIAMKTSLNGSLGLVAVNLYNNRPDRRSLRQLNEKIMDALAERSTPDGRAVE